MFNFLCKLTVVTCLQVGHSIRPLIAGDSISPALEEVEEADEDLAELN